MVLAGMLHVITKPVTLTRPSSVIGTRSTWGRMNVVEWVQWEKGRREEGGGRRGRKREILYIL